MAYRFDGNEGTFIPTTEATKMVADYQKGKPEEAIKAYFFGKNKLQSLLDEAGSMGIRIYYAEGEDGKQQMVLVAADADGNDLDALLLDRGSPCKPNCPPDSIFNK